MEAQDINVLAENVVCYAVHSKLQKVAAKLIR